MQRSRQQLTNSEPVLPVPLEQQLESIVEETLSQEPLPELALVSSEPERQRIVVTGIGIISPLGNTVAAFWDALSAGRSGIGYNDLVPNYREYPCHVAATVRDWDPHQYLDAEAARHMSRSAQFGVAAAKMALEDAKLTVDPSNAEDVGVVLGSGSAVLPEAEHAVRSLIERSGSEISPLFIPSALPNMAAYQIGVQLGLRGYNSTIATACAASAQAIGEAVEIIKRGDAEVLLAGGAEASICEVNLAAFSAMHALSTHNDDPPQASRPFDATRNGFVPAEGAAVLVLETLEHARARGAQIYGEIIGYGVGSEAQHATSPDPVGDGALRSMQRALLHASVTPQQVDYINAHAAGTPGGDLAETRVIKSVFGEYASTVAVSSTKSMHGHLASAAGAVEAVATLLALKYGLIPPTINYQVADPECDLDYVPNVARQAPIAIALSNSFGYGGQNATLVFQKYEEHRRLSPAEMAVEAEIEGWLDEQ